MKAISLFSGGGGVDFALEQLGVDVILSNDNDKSSCETLSRYFPHTDVIHDDVRNLSKFPSVDLLVGGYPCQSFSLGGVRKPKNDPRTYLFLEYARVLGTVRPKFFVAENVSGMAGVENGQWFKEQVRLYDDLGYRVSHKLLNARDYGVPQRRKRIFIVGVRKDLGGIYEFPAATHSGDPKAIAMGMMPYASHGDAIKDLPLHPKGEFYERPHDETGHMSWYYMSRNRKANWAEPSFCIVANFRHITLHPACQTMECVWSNLADGFKQKWDFTGEYEHIANHPERSVIEIPRRLSWRECARIQTFPKDYMPSGDLERKFQQVGNAVPPMLFQKIVEGLVSGSSIRPVQLIDGDKMFNQRDLFGVETA